MNAKYIYLFILIFFSLGDLIAQPTGSDSLRMELKNSKGKQRVLILNELALNLRESAQQEAFDYALEAEKLSRELGDKVQEAKAMESIGWMYYRRGQWQKTFDYSSRAYVLAMEGGDIATAGAILNSMGALYIEQRNYPKAYEHFKKAYDISSAKGDSYTIMRSLNNIAFTYLQTEDLDSALYYAEKVVHISDISESKYLNSYAHRIVGDVQYRRGQYEQAVETFKEALIIAETGEASSFTSSILHRIGNAYLKLNRSEEAKAALENAIKIATENNYVDELSKAKRNLSEYYVQKGDYKGAYVELSKYLTLYDSLVNQSTQDRIALMQGMFEEDLSQSELQLLIAQNENQANRLVSIQRIGILIGVSSFVFLVLMIWLIYLNRNIKKVNDQLKKQRQHISKQNQSLEITSDKLKEINQTKNKLFSILGHDLRGPISQVNSVVDLLLTGDLSKEEFNRLASILKFDVETVHFTLENTLKWSITQMEGFNISKSNINLHTIVKNNIRLFQPQLRDKSISISDKIDMDYMVYADPDLVDVVVRNLINNAIKFSKESTTITFSYLHLDDTVLFSIQDEGVGMEQNKINQILDENHTILPSELGTKREKGSGLGLQISKEFTRMNDGKLIIQSQVDKGTKVTLELPAASI